jgi:site-specific DNA-methyltransferase (adenine-specific)
MLEIRPYPQNAKKHPKKQIEQVANSIKEFGMNQPIVVDKQGVIIVGHGRYEALKSLGMEVKDEYIKVVDLTEEQAKAYRSPTKLNESEWDMNLVIEELKGLSEQMLELTGFDKDLIIEPDEADDEVPDVPEEPQSKLGDLYELGEHRVLCGDSTKIEDVERLMNGKKADMVFTDPPYNVDATSRSKKRGLDKIKNDDMSDGDFEQFCLAFFTSFVSFSKEGSAHYYWHNHHCQTVFEKAINASGLNIRNQIIWSKDIPSYSNNEYRQKHEVCFYCHSVKVDRPEYFGKKDSSVWEVPSVQSAKSVGDDGTTWFKGGSNTLNLHVTQKPVALPEKAIIGSSKQEDIVLDLFLGSGSTLIASEKTGRERGSLTINMWM